ncbi:enoyl-CoA hydratase-related protein [Streptomyces sp. NPDC001880]
MTEASVTPAVRTEQHDGVFVITIDRPQARNAIDGATARALAAAIDELESRDELLVGILTGANGVFSAGMDLKERCRRARRVPRPAAHPASSYERAQRSRKSSPARSEVLVGVWRVSPDLRCDPPHGDSCSTIRSRIAHTEGPADQLEVQGVSLRSRQEAGVVADQGGVPADRDRHTVANPPLDERDGLVERRPARTGVTHRGVLEPDRHAAEENELVRW